MCLNGSCTVLELEVDAMNFELLVQSEIQNHEARKKNFFFAYSGFKFVKLFSTDLTWCRC